MAKPTPAQIEAAKKLIYRFEYESMALHHIQRDWLVKEIAALTTAAQVGEQPFLCPQCGARGYVKDGATTTTAQVGEQPSDPITEFEKGTIGWAMAVKRLQDNATIERCAQVADELANQYGGQIGMVLRQAAAAIRKLKDEP